MADARRRDKDFSRLDSHVELEMKRLVEEDGLSFKDARLKALRSFGNVTAARERFYESRRLIWVEDLKRNLRHARCDRSGRLPDLRRSRC